MGKRGAKPKHYITAGGETILGLRRDKKSGRFYPVGKGSPNFGTDEARAIHRFKMWQAQQGEQPKPTIPVTMPASIDALDVGVGYAGKDEPSRRMILATWSPDGIETDVESIRRQERHRIRDLIYSNPRQAAVELNCEPLALLANVKDLKPPQPSKRLPELCDTYLDDKTLRNKKGQVKRSARCDPQKGTSSLHLAGFAFAAIRSVSKSPEGVVVVPR